MVKYVIKRILQSILVLISVSIISFSVMFLSGDPTYLYVNERATNEQIEMVRHNLGFDLPIHIQYFRFFKKAVKGDFGVSMKYGTSAIGIVLERLPATLELMLSSLLISLILAIPIGAFAAINRGSGFDGGSMVFAMVGQSVPQFWLGLMLILLFGVKMRILPISGRVALLEPILNGDLRQFFINLPEGIRHLILPGLASGVWSLSRNARLIRSSMLEVLNMDYITTARAKGLKERKIILKHAFKNAMIPVTTMVGLQIGFLMSGSIVIENIFAWPGLGRLVIFAINQKDFNIVQSGVIVMALIFITINLIVDFLYTIMDPRIRLAK